MRIVTYMNRPVAKIVCLPSGRLLLKLYERLPGGRARRLRITAAQWQRGRQDLWFDGTESRSAICRRMAAEAISRSRARQLQVGG